jgi:hypothetical protein
MHYFRGVKKRELDFVIDRLTDSIVNIHTGDSFQTEVSLLTKEELKTINKKTKWNFDWNIEYKDLTREVYKLTITSSPNVIQGLVSLSKKKGYIEMNLLESAPFNIGKKKNYEGVAGNLVAYCCKVSFQSGFDGYVAFTAKTQLIIHYQKTLGATHYRNQRMFIESGEAKKLVEKYFK